MPVPVQYATTRIVGGQAIHIQIGISSGQLQGQYFQTHRVPSALRTCWANLPLAWSIAYRYFAATGGAWEENVSGQKTKCRNDNSARKCGRRFRWRGGWVVYWHPKGVSSVIAFCFVLLSTKISDATGVHRLESDTRGRSFTVKQAMRR